jgi:hypothetical protein
MMVEGSFGMAAALAKSLDPEERKLGEAYFQFGTRMLAAGDADARSVPPANKVAQYVEAIKSGDKALIEKAKSDFVAKYPLLGQTVVDSFASLEGTGKAPKKPDGPGIVESATAGAAKPAPAAPKNNDYTKYGPMTNWKEIEAAYNRWREACWRERWQWPGTPECGE